MRPIITASILTLVIALVAIGVVILIPLLRPQVFSPLAFEIVSTEGTAQIQDLSSHLWRTPKRGEEFQEGQKIRTGADGIINFQVEGQIMLRLKENGELLNKQCRVQDQKDIYRIRLSRGVLLGATTKEFNWKVSGGKALLEVITPRYTAIPRSAIFRIVAADDSGREDKVGVLRGQVEMNPNAFFQKRGITIRGLERAGMIDSVLQPAVRVTSEEWQEMKEAYELLAKSAAMEAEQIDLSKLAGSFFREVVFDHGTFFTPKLGYSGREFYKDPESGKVYLETEYDVFPDESFAGVYIKTRNFDAARYDGMNFEVRRKGEEGFPDSFFIELKSKGNVLRRFPVNGFHQKWTPVELKFSASKETPINEVVFVFTNKRVGEAKKGMLEFRDFNLVPKKQEPALPKSSQAAKAAAKSAEPLPASPVPAPEKPVVPLAPVPSERPQAQAPQESSDEEMVPQIISLR